MFFRREEKAEQALHAKKDEAAENTMNGMNVPEQTDIKDSPEAVSSAEERRMNGVSGDEARKKTKKAAAGAAAGLAAVSLLLGSVFTKPAEILQQADPNEGKPTVVVEYNAPVDEDIDAEEEDEDEKKRTLKDMVRAFIQNLPLWAKILFVLPLWLIGYALIALLTALFEPVIAPALLAVLKWLLFAGLLALGLFFVKKAVAPNTPLKEIFKKRNVILILITAALLGTGDYFAKEYIAHYETWRNWICCAAGVLILGLCALGNMKKAKEKKKQ
ncbi:MAG: hypothetical protein IJM50_00340 [Lachnospiraceae bacterium]|nr:hypothetical protein [Lachnospiraceae bacterium]